MNKCEFFFSFIVSLLTTILGVILGYFFSERSNRKNEISNAKINFKNAFLDELIKFQRTTAEIEGAKIYNVLIKAYPKHCAAIYNFSSNLAGKTLIDFNCVWHQYQYPDNNTDSGVFGYYITPDETGKVKVVEPSFVFHKIESLLSFAKP